nr:ionotropic receptor 21a-like [Cherax quadricarinatus]
MEIVASVAVLMLVSPLSATRWQFLQENPLTPIHGDDTGSYPYQGELRESPGTPAGGASYGNHVNPGQDVPLDESYGKDARWASLYPGGQQGNRSRFRGTPFASEVPPGPLDRSAAFRSLWNVQRERSSLPVAPKAMLEEEETSFVREMLEAVLEREMKGCDLVLIHDGGNTHQLLHHLLHLLPHLRQVVEIRRPEDLMGVLWSPTSSCEGVGGYIFLLHSSQPLLTFLNTDDNSWDYYGRYFMIGLQLGELEAVSESRKGRKTEHLAGVVKSSVEGEWEVYMNQIYCGSGIKRLAIWRRHRFTSQVEIYPDKISNLRGSTLKVVTFVWEPSIFYQRGADGEVTHRYGIDILVIEALASAMNFTVEYQEPPNGEMWGTATGNGTYTGLRGRLYRGEADIGVANMYFTLNQQVGIQFSARYDTEFNCFLVRSEPPLPLWQALSFPFSRWMWLAVFLCLLASGPVLYLVARGTAACGEDIPELRTLSSGFTYSFATLLGKSAVRDPKPVSAHLLVLSLWLYGMIVTIAYSTNLTAFLLVSRRPYSMETFKELHDSGLRVFGLGDLFKQELASASDIYLKELSRTYEGYSSPGQIFPKVLEGQGALLENHGFLEFTAATRFASRGQSRVRIMKECFAPYNIAMGLQTHSPLKRRLDVVLGWIQQAGLVRRFFLDSLRLAKTTKEYRGASVGEGGEDRVEGGVIPLSLNHLQGAFLIVLIGSFVATLVFLLEMYLMGRGVV